MKTQPAKASARGRIEGAAFPERMHQLREARPDLVSLGEVADLVVSRFGVDRECAVAEVCTALLSATECPVYYFSQAQGRQEVLDRGVAISSFRVNGWREVAGQSYANAVQIPRQVADRLFGAKSRTAAASESRSTRRNAGASEAEMIDTKSLMRRRAQLKAQGQHLGSKNDWLKRLCAETGLARRTIQHRLARADADREAALQPVWHAPVTAKRGRNKR